MKHDKRWQYDPRFEADANEKLNILQKMFDEHLRLASDEPGSDGSMSANRMLRQLKHAGLPCGLLSLACWD
jgi:hypothetical protein